MYSSPQFIHRTSAFFPRNDHSPSVCRECSIYKEHSWNIPNSPSVSRECSLYVPSESFQDAGPQNEPNNNDHYASTPSGLFCDSLVFNGMRTDDFTSNILEPVYHECFEVQKSSVAAKPNRFPPIWEENYGEI